MPVSIVGGDSCYHEGKRRRSWYELSWAETGLCLSRWLGQNQYVCNWYSSKYRILEPPSSWANIPKVVGSISALFRHIFQLARCGYRLGVTQASSRNSLLQVCNFRLFSTPVWSTTFNTCLERCSSLWPRKNARLMQAASTFSQPEAVTTSWSLSSRAVANFHSDMAPWGWALTSNVSSNQRCRKQMTSFWIHVTSWCMRLERTPCWASEIV